MAEPPLGGDRPSEATAHPSARRHRAPQRSTLRRVTRDWTLLAVIGSIAAGVACGVLASRAGLVTIAGRQASTAVGAVIIVVGIALRLWAIVVLGRFFKITVTIQ